MAGEAANRQKLISYNAEDCQVLRILTDKLVRLRTDADSELNVDYVDRPKQNATSSTFSPLGRNAATPARFPVLLHTAELPFLLGLARAWILCSGRRSLTRIIQSAQLTESTHNCSFHRFFSQAR
jgi:hypothetical protein